MLRSLRMPCVPWGPKATLKRQHRPKARLDSVCRYVISKPEHVIFSAGLEQLRNRCGRLAGQRTRGREAPFCGEAAEITEVPGPVLQTQFVVLEISQR